MPSSLLRTKYVKLIVILAVIIWFIFSYLFKAQSTVMYAYFIEKPPEYYIKVESMARLLCLDFQQKMTSPSLKKIKYILEQYNAPPSLTVDFVYTDKKGILRSLLKGIKESDLVAPEYIHPIRLGKLDGKIFVYDMNTQFKKKFKEYERITNITKFTFVAILVLIISLFLFREYTTRIEEEKREVDNLRRKAESKAVRDGLTGLFNQKQFKKMLGEEIAKTKELGRPISIVMCDLDHFKNLNDTYGHLAGDKVLKTVAEVVQKSVRAYDIVGRYGGEEFGIILLGSVFEDKLTPEARHKNLVEKTLIAAHRIKDDIQNTRIFSDGKQINVTMSMGVSFYDGSEEKTQENLISEADKALYHSKENGRNRISIFEHSGFKEG